jgi:hypothetical protein
MKSPLASSLIWSMKHKSALALHARLLAPFDPSGAPGYGGAVELKNRLMKQLQNWIPKTHKCCVRCKAYVRLQARLWSHELNIQYNGVKSDKVGVIAKFEMTAFSRLAAQNCPPCYLALWSENPENGSGER